MAPRIAQPCSVCCIKSSSASRTFSTSAPRTAQLIRRPHRPYQFTQLLALSDGSTVLHRTTSPTPLYRSTRDTRNSPLWNPSNVKMANVEEDEAGRLRAFRRRFGRGWDARSGPADEVLAEAAVAEQPTTGGERVEAAREAQVGEATGEAAGTKLQGAAAASAQARKAEDDGDGSWSAEDEDNLMDLISEAGLAGPQHKGPVATAQKGKAAAKGKKR